MSAQVLVSLRGGRGRVVVNGTEVPASRVVLIADANETPVVRITIPARHVQVIAHDAEVKVDEAPQG